MYSGNSWLLITDEYNNCVFSCTLQGIVKSMGCVLLAPLASEVVKKDKSPDHCQAAITHLTRVGANY